MAVKPKPGKRVQYRVTPETHEQLVDAADRAGQTIEGYVAQAIRERIARDAKTKG